MLKYIEINEGRSNVKISGRILKDILFTFIILASAFCVSVFVQKVLIVDEHITTLFVFAVFIISLITDGYAYGIVASALAVIAINYAFTFPYFEFDFAAAENLISAVVMIIVSLLTSTLTTRLKKWETDKADSEREKMRANLLRAVSHDLRTPLTTIYGSSSAMLEGYDGFSEEQRRKMIGGIKSDSEWLIRMVENLLSVTKLEGDSLKLVKTPTVLEELVDSVVLKFKKRYPDKKLTLSLPDEVIVIPMDPILIEQVTVNILDNAVLHAKGMTEISLSVYSKDDTAVFEIADNGEGIPEDRLPYLFTGYLGVSGGSSDNKKHNLGIGLSVCATIIKAHGGEIFAENRKEGGALFRFGLKMEDPESE